MFQWTSLEACEVHWRKTLPRAEPEPGPAARGASLRQATKGRDQQQSNRDRSARNESQFQHLLDISPWTRVGDPTNNATASDIDNKRPKDACAGDFIGPHRFRDETTTAGWSRGRLASGQIASRAGVLAHDGAHKTNGTGEHRRKTSKDNTQWEETKYWRYVIRDNTRQ